MPLKCSVPLCPSIWKKPESNAPPDERIMFHAYPINDQELVKKWIANINCIANYFGQNLIISAQTKVCSKHFRESDYDSEGVWSQKSGHIEGLHLKKNAIPTIFYNHEGNRYKGRLPVRACKVPVKRSASTPIPARGNLDEETPGSSVTKAKDNSLESHRSLWNNDSETASSTKRATYKERKNPEGVANMRWLSASCVTVFGFLPDLLGDVLLKFSKVGEIIEFKSERKKNWVHVRFERPSQANSALKRNATFLNDDIMIAVKPCSYIPVKTEDDDTANKELAWSFALQDEIDGISDNMDVSSASLSPGTQADDEYEKSDQEIEHLSFEAYGQVKRVKRKSAEEEPSTDKVTLNERSDTDNNGLTGVQFKFNAPATFECEQCHKTYPSKWSHLGTNACIECVKPFVCGECFMSFPRESNLEKHFIDVHIPMNEQEKKRHVLCDKCGKEFPDKDCLQKHTLSKHGEEHFECGTCGLQCSSKVSFREHVRMHFHEKEFLCDICGKGLSSKRGMVIHVNTQHMKEDSFQCEMCGKYFSSQQYLKDHQQFTSDCGDKKIKARNWQVPVRQ